MKANTIGAKINVVTSIVVKTLVKNPLAATAVFCSRDHIVSAQTLTAGENIEEVSLSLGADFDAQRDYLISVTRSEEDGSHCHFQLLAGTAPDWFEYPENEVFNLLGGSDTMDRGSRFLVAMPVRFIAERLAKEKPRV
jgi:hypothetical protein